jgi:hypothetical protein
MYLLIFCKIETKSNDDKIQERRFELVQSDNLHEMYGKIDVGNNIRMDSLQKNELSDMIRITLKHTFPEEKLLRILI